MKKRIQDRGAKKRRRSSLEKEGSGRKCMSQDNEPPFTVWRFAFVLTKACGREGSRGKWSRRMSAAVMRLMNDVLLLVYFAFQHVSLANEHQLEASGGIPALPNPIFILVVSKSNIIS